VKFLVSAKQAMLSSVIGESSHVWERLIYLVSQTVLTIRYTVSHYHHTGNSCSGSLFPCSSDRPREIYVPGQGHDAGDHSAKRFRYEIKVDQVDRRPNFVLGNQHGRKVGATGIQDCWEVRYCFFRKGKSKLVMMCNRSFATCVFRPEK
jgi:hypothetical protein